MSLFKFKSLARKGLSCVYQKNVSVKLGFARTISSSQSLDCPSAPVSSSGLEIPLIGLGTWQADDEVSLRKAVRTAVKLGYHYIDTAFKYGNESILGKELRRIFREDITRREYLFITTKLPQNGMRPENVEYFFRKSLDALQLDYIDLYLIHAPIPTLRTNDDNEVFPFKDNDILVENVDLVETWKAMESLVHKGYVRSLGLSNCNSQQVQRVYDAATIKPTNLQVECHPYLPQHDLHEFCEKLGISLTAYGPLGSPGLPEYAKKLWPHWEYNPPKLLEDKTIGEICKKHKKTPAQVLLRYLTQRGITAIPKSTNEARLKENIESFSFKLDSEDFDLIKTMESGFRYFKYDFVPSFRDHPERPF